MEDEACKKYGGGGIRGGVPGRGRRGGAGDQGRGGRREQDPERIRVGKGREEDDRGALRGAEEEDRGEAGGGQEDQGRDRQAEDPPGQGEAQGKGGCAFRQARGAASDDPGIGEGDADPPGGADAARAEDHRSAAGEDRGRGKDRPGPGPGAGRRRPLRSRDGYHGPGAADGEQGAGRWEMSSVCPNWPRARGRGWKGTATSW